MNAAKIEQLVIQLKDEIYSKLHHRTLLEYTGQPPIWEDQLFYLLLPKFNGEQWTKQHQVAAQSVAMIQTALTTHDLVEEFKATSKEQQLMVLAGDYYSGMYYATLSTLPNVQLVRELSAAVADISEKKTALYESSTKALTEWIELFEEVVSQTVEQFMKHYDFSAYIEFMKMGMLIERLATELKKIEQKTTTIRFVQVVAKNYASEQQAYTAIQDELQKRIVKLLETVEKSTLLASTVKEGIKGRIEVHNTAQQMTGEGL